MAGTDSLEKLVTASLSDVGRSRSENQDSWREMGNALGEHLLVLADGMGGHRGGGEASRMCVQILEQHFLEQHDPVEVRLRRGLAEANAEILRRGLEDSDLGGMGATCVALALCPDGQAWVAWAGDSRLYRLRSGQLEQLTEDHSLVAEWQKLGVLTAAQAASHPKRNELTRAIGVTREIEPELRALEVQPGDRYLLCSDGLSGPVDAETLRQVLCARPPDAAARALIESANARGGPDNVTVQIAWLPDDQEELASVPEEMEPEPMPELGPIAIAVAQAAPSPKPEAALELPVRPPPLAPLIPSAAERARAATPGQQAAEPAGSGARARAPRSSGGPGRGVHAPSLVGGILIGLALAMAATAYLRWQSAAPEPQPLAPQPEVPEAKPAVTAPAAEPILERKPREVARRSAPPPANVEAAAAPTQAQADPGIVIVGDVPQDGEIRWIPVAEPVPTSRALELPEPVHAFLDAWLAALTGDDAAAHAALGFPISAAEFARTEASRESYRLVEAEISPRSTPAQTFLRVALSYAFQNGSGRFRTEDELRLILEPDAGGLRFAGYWQE